MEKKINAIFTIFFLIALIQPSFAASKVSVSPKMVELNNQITITYATTPSNPIMLQIKDATTNQAIATINNPTGGIYSYTIGAGFSEKKLYGVTAVYANSSETAYFQVTSTSRTTPQLLIAEIPIYLIPLIGIIFLFILRKK